MESLSSSVLGCHTLLLWHWATEHTRWMGWLQISFHTPVCLDLQTRHLIVVQHNKIKDELMHLLGKATLSSYIHVD